MTAIELPQIESIATADPHASLRRASAIAVAAIALFNLFDVITTRAMLARGAIESNPLAALLLPHGRVELFKAAVLGFLVLRVIKRRPTIGFTAALWFGAGFYALTVVSNLLILQRLG